MSSSESPGGRALRFFRKPGRITEIVVWVLIIAAIIGIRVYLVHLLPAVLWSRDSGSYIGAPLRWQIADTEEIGQRDAPVVSRAGAASPSIR